MSSVGMGGTSIPTFGQSRMPVALGPSQQQVASPPTIPPSGPILEALIEDMAESCTEGSPHRAVADEEP